MERASMQIVGIHHAIILPCDLIIIATPTLLGTHNPKLVGPENIVFRVILRWNPLHGLRLAKIEE